jgi:hypothetical protein
MAFDANGNWKPEDDSVATRLNALTTSNSPYITAARTSGMATANRRGLLNSSMAAGASEGAAIAAAAPIASQDAQQLSQKNLAYQQGGYDMDRQKIVTASADRSAALSAALTANGQYLDSFNGLAANKDIPAATRDAYITHLQNTRSTGLDMIQQVYGINLDWAGKPGASTAPAPAAGGYGVVPTDKNGVQGGGGGFNPYLVP